jgi:hypothetical protein
MTAWYRQYSALTPDVKMDTWHAIDKASFYVRRWQTVPVLTDDAPRSSPLMELSFFTLIIELSVLF